MSQQSGNDSAGFELLPDAVAERSEADRLGPGSHPSPGQYSRRGDRDLSYADAIHLAIAVVHEGCEALYSGDPDFEGVDEIEKAVI